MFMGNRTSGLLLQTMLYLSTQNGGNKDTETNTLYHLNIGEGKKNSYLTHIDYTNQQ